MTVPRRIVFLSALGHFLFPGFLFLYARFAPDTWVDKAISFICVMGFLTSTVTLILCSFAATADKGKAYQPEHLHAPLTIRPRNLMIAGAFLLWFGALCVKDILFGTYHI